MSFCSNTWASVADIQLSITFPSLSFKRSLAPATSLLPVISIFLIDTFVTSICTLKMGIECERSRKHSTHSDRVTNIGCRLSLRASVLSHKLNSYPCIFSIRRAVSSVNFFKELTIAAFCADNSSHCFFSSSTLRRLSS